MLISIPAQTEPKGGDANFDLDFTSSGADDFLSREKAALGDEADMFATSNDSAAFIDSSDGDLLGNGGDEETRQFESSFPEISTQNDVSASHSVTNHLIQQPS